MTGCFQVCLGFREVDLEPTEGHEGKGHITWKMDKAPKRPEGKGLAFPGASHGRGGL